MKLYLIVALIAGVLLTSSHAHETQNSVNVTRSIIEDDAINDGLTTLSEETPEAEESRQRLRVKKSSYLTGTPLDVFEQESDLPQADSDDLDESITLPAEFDARKKWPQCASISRVVQQGTCASW